jgi:phosphoglycerate dehydrogenase-like enzyme
VPELVDGEEIVVGVLYPAEWYGDAAAFAEAIAELEAIDDRIRVVAEAYDEPHELRSARGTPGAERVREQAPALTEAQAAAFEQVHVAVAIDLPFDIGTVAPSLRWVQAVGAGTGQLQSAGLADAGIRLTSAAGANAVGIAEFAIGRVLQHWKRFRELDDAQRVHQWEPRYGRQLAGDTLGLIGMGAINSAVASRAKAFDVRVLTTRRSATPGSTAPNVDEVYPTDELFTMLGRADAVIAAVPETPETEGLMSREAFAAMKPGSFFCNVGRGSLVDEGALIDALGSGHLRAAALDVASVEPLPPDHPLWDVPNLYLSPHAASSPAALFANLHVLFRENLARYVAGEALVNEVDLGRGY